MNFDTHQKHTLYFGKRYMVGYRHGINYKGDIQTYTKRQNTWTIYIYIALNPKYTNTHTQMESIVWYTYKAKQIIQTKHFKIN